MTTGVEERIAGVRHLFTDVPRLSDRSTLPPGPKLPTILQTAGMVQFRERFMPWAARRYGTPFTLTIAPGKRTMVAFHEPEAVREIFAGDPKIFQAGKGNAILGPLMGEHSLLLVDADQHTRARKMLMPAFTPNAISDYRTMVDRITADHVAAWPTGKAFASHESMNELTLDVILQTVFGVDDHALLAEFRPLVQAVIQTPPYVLLGYNVPRLHRIGPWRRSIVAQDRLDAAIYRQIADMRATDLSDRVDVLSRLLQVHDDEGNGLTDAELRDQLVTLLMAGHETTATALAWALHELGSDPVLLEKATLAADDGDERYLEAVLKEAMRVHPVIAMIGRLLMEPATIGGIELPAGTYVTASIVLAHQDPAHHPRVEEFRPERFLEGEVHANTWIPFGGGVRRCIGAGFSLMEGVAVLRQVLSDYEIAVPAGSPERTVVRNITAVPKFGAQIIATPRG